MPADVTLCPGGTCPLREGCFRFRAQPEARQDWFGHPPYDASLQRCEHLWSLAAMAPTDAAIRVRAYHLWERDGRPDGRADAHWNTARAELEAAITAQLRR